jgi:pyruvate ferredoxin oxidoreductase gamma subunit
MWQVRIHGRGGQGVVTAAELLSVAAFRQGLHAQAFPVFGSERMGAPVVSFVRASRDPIRAHDPVEVPDAVIVQDVTLLGAVDVLAGLDPAGFVVVNTARSLPELQALAPAGWPAPEHVATVPATDLALTHVGRPVPNVPLLGGFAALTRWISLASLVDAVEERFPARVARANADAARAAHGLVESARRLVEEEARRAHTG